MENVSMMNFLISVRIGDRSGVFRLSLHERIVKAWEVPVGCHKKEVKERQKFFHVKGMG
jgi:hypothetical protein